MSTSRLDQGSSMAAAEVAEAFESYFTLADLDGDGRISGKEAVAFFQGSNLPKTVLSKIWANVDEKRTGFLAREEFYNALRLITVAQNCSELTPAVVLAALEPAAAPLIPPPKILLPPKASLPTKFSSASNVSAGNAGPAPSQSQLPWPKFRQADIQKYIGIFLKVDRDRDGKISGLEARNLFLSWNLPKDVLKKIWDLSDQESDGMLSLREFCIALYLMQQFREGRPLPEELPDSIKTDQTLLYMTGQVLSENSDSDWQPTAVTQEISGSRPPLPATFENPPPPAQGQTLLHSIFQEVSDAEKQIHELEMGILESIDKIEFHRIKMQELEEVASALVAEMEIPFQYKATESLQPIEIQKETSTSRNVLPHPSASPLAEYDPIVEQVCPICFTNPKDMAFGCGHLTCKDCGPTLSACPICRASVTVRVRLFI